MSFWFSRLNSRYSIANTKQRIQIPSLILAIDPFDIHRSIANDRRPCSCFFSPRRYIHDHWSSSTSTSTTQSYKTNTKNSSSVILGFCSRTRSRSLKLSIGSGGRDRHAQRLYSTIPDSYPRNPASWSKWVVKLLLYWDDPKNANSTAAVGSGFFVNIPGSQKDVIFTAGHNLINKEGQYVKAVDVILDGEPSTRVQKLGEDFYISESYKITPNDTNSIDDYGCILIPRVRDIHGKEIVREGFGFSIPLAYTNPRDFGLKAFVGGYPGELNIGDNVEFRYALGDFGQADPGQLFYHASTEKGQSGGPVWVLYKGYETVIGIHNHDERAEGAGNRATRLDIDTLYEIYKWAGVGAFSKSIRVVSYKGSEGLYLKVSGGPAGGTFAHLGKQGVNTTFDIIPAHAAPTDAGRAPRFALVNKPSSDPQSWLWLSFNTDPRSRPRQVTVKNSATEDGMVRVHSAGKLYQIEAASLSEKPPSPQDPRYLLRVEGKGIPANIEDGDDTEPESMDVQLVDVKSGAKTLTDFTKLSFE